ncbi:MaoC family dehydratase [Gordonia sp. VNK21]|uniref:MaoC family dehydratase n=1 Tax=Gordonia sp. VNK21 TaxID=3382483 RepID=UPI0038D4C7DF
MADITTINGEQELRDAVGRHLGHSEWTEVTQEQVNLFADATGDHQWIHVDQEKAAAGPFGGTIAHGYLTLSLVPLLRKQAWQVTGPKMGINYGANKVRFPSPVRVGSRVRGGFEVTEVNQTPAGYQVVEKVTVEIEGESKPALVAEVVTVMVF